MTSLPSRQRGVTLLVSLIMLVLITMLAITSFRLGKANLQIAGNMQQRNQAFAAAQGALEQVISNVNFTTNPGNAIRNPCNGLANTTCTDVNGDGVMDVNTVVTLTCVWTQTIPISQLTLSDPNDAGCLRGLERLFGQPGAENTNSLCANMLWDARAVATDSISNAQFTVNQSIMARVDANTACP